MNNCSTVLAGGSFPGPLLTGHTGDTFDVNVIDQLTDGRMNKTVSVVSSINRELREDADCLPGALAWLSSTRHSLGGRHILRYTMPDLSGPCIPVQVQDRGTRRDILVSLSPGHPVLRWPARTHRFVHKPLLSSIEHLLRRCPVVYDRNDPHKSLYDVDDASTVITLADWYHFPSNTAPPGPV